MFKKKEECFICYSSGKSENEIMFETVFNQKSMDYPLILLKDAYACKCKNSYAHNKCLVTINKCPTCRKESFPNLYIITRYDYYFKYLLIWLKKDTSNIEKLNLYMGYLQLFALTLLCICAFFQEQIRTVIKPKSTGSVCLAIMIGLPFWFSLYILLIFNDYLKKYWLYNKKTKKYDVFKNEIKQENNLPLISQLRIIIRMQQNHIEELQLQLLRQ